VPRISYKCRTALSLVALILITFVQNESLAQGSDSLVRELTVDMEVRPRAEYRDHFRWTPADSVQSQLYLTVRNRLSISFKTKNLRIQASPQEIHILAGPNRFSRVGSINFFELYAENALTKNISVRAGRQALSLDNGRIFSAAPWSQQSRAHEGVRIFYRHKFESDLMLAFTRPYNKHFDPAYSPVTSHTYKYLFVHHLKYKFNNGVTVTTINSTDIFQRNNQSYYPRMTNGGRAEYVKGRLYVTLNAYYQHGQNAAADRIRAYYFQPEASWNTGKTLFRLGAEMLSGDKNAAPKTVFGSFVPLYGVAWKFMGNMNLFTRFPADVNEKGLINPYLFVICQVNKKLALRADAHFFYSQYPLLFERKEVSGKYLGFESDLSLSYRPLKILEFSYGFSFALADERMELLNKVANAEKVPVWTYLMISYSPRLYGRRWFKSL